MSRSQAGNDRAHVDLVSTMPRQSKTRIFVVSDGRGDTASQLVSAAALQFQDVPYEIQKYAEVRTPERVEQIVKKAAKLKGVIFYTLVSEAVTDAMRRAAESNKVTAVDLLGPTFLALDATFGRKHGSTPGLLYTSERQRFDRMDAIDYTLAHDDGRRPHELAAADVVLVGVSRASKSTTCFYLASAGIKAANVPLVPGIAPPGELLGLASTKVIGLRVNTDRLLTVREARSRTLGLKGSNYTDRRSVAKELAYANRLMDRHGWRYIDVSYSATEEVARQVTQLIGLSGGRGKLS